MKFDQALARIGATIVKNEKRGDQVILMIRVDPKKQALWNEVISEYLLASVDGRVSWTTDVSKYFFAVKDSGVVRFFWRVVLGVDAKAAAEAFGRAAQRAVAAGVEVTSQPLVGRKEFVHDPANGRIAGAYGIGQGASLIAGQVRR